MTARLRAPTNLISRRSYMSERKGICCAALGVLLSLALLVPVSEAQFKVTDNFNRPDGAVGLGWSTWGNGAQISSNQLETFGEPNVAGGIERALTVTFPLSFSFDFSTDAPADGGWLIGFNASSADSGDNAAEVGMLQPSGSREACTIFQTTSGRMQQCFGPVHGQRDFTAKAHISGTLNSDFSGKVMIKYNDGLTPASVTIKMTAPAGAIQNPLGSLFFFGNENATLGPHFFDNFSLSLN
jgi:hypothetical protein